MRGKASRFAILTSNNRFIYRDVTVFESSLLPPSRDDSFEDLALNKRINNCVE